MKKALMIMAAVSMSAAHAQQAGGRSAGSAQTELIFNMKVVPGCAVFLASSYSSNPADASYNGTDSTPTTLNIDAASEGPNLRCQTGTQVTISATATEGIGNGFQVVTATDSTPPIEGRLSLVKNGFVLTDGNNNDDKTLEGNYTVAFNKFNLAGGNGDTYKLSASFKPDAGQFEPEVGDYSGTVYVTINY